MRLSLSKLYNNNPSSSCRCSFPSSWVHPRSAPNVFKPLSILLLPVPAFPLPFPCRRRRRLPPLIANPLAFHPRVGVVYISGCSEGKTNGILHKYPTSRLTTKPSFLLLTPPSWFLFPLVPSVSLSLSLSLSLPPPLSLCLSLCLSSFLFPSFSFFPSPAPSRSIFRQGGTSCLCECSILQEDG